MKDIEMVRTSKVLMYIAMTAFAAIAFVGSGYLTDARAGDVSAGASVASECVWRGYSVSAGEPCARGYVGYAMGPFYVKAEGGNRSQVAALSSFDLTGTAGISANLSKHISVDAGVSYNHYFGSLAPGHLSNDFLEFHAGAAVTTDAVNVAVTARYSPDYIFDTGEQWRVEGEVSRDFDFVIGTTLTPFVRAAHNTGAFDYQDFGAGLRLSRGGVYLEGAYSDTTGLMLPGGLVGAFGDARAVVTLGVDL